MRLELFVFLADGEEVQLLRQQAGRAGGGEADGDADLSAAGNRIADL